MFDSRFLGGYHFNSMKNGDPVDKILGQWQRERPDLDASPMGVIGRMARLAKHLDRSIQETVSEFGLNPGEFDVLATLRRSGHPYQLSPTDLFNALMVSSGTMTHRIDRLEQADLVKRIPDPSDRRGMLVQLTNQGFNVIEKAVEAHVANGHRVLIVLEEAECKVLAQLLHKLLIRFEE
ncbi:MAG: MarR family transcriptional regulator [Cyanobacteriota bacterium]